MYSCCMPKEQDVQQPGNPKSAGNFKVDPKISIAPSSSRLITATKQEILGTPYTRSECDQSFKISAIQSLVRMKELRLMVRGSK